MVAGFNAVCEMKRAPLNCTLLAFRLSRTIDIWRVDGDKLAEHCDVIDLGALA